MLLFSLEAASVQAQSVTSGSVVGTVQSEVGLGLASALVTLRPVGSESGAGREVPTSASGSFVIPFVQPGEYELLVEAIGYRPVLARVLTVSGGEERRVSLRVSVNPPPVLSVDTVALGTSAATRWGTTSVQLSGRNAREVPHRFEDLSSVVALSSVFDASLGAQGLPGDMTLIVADGVPFYRAPHPTVRSESLPSGPFPASSVAGVTAFQTAIDPELAGSAGGYVGVATRAFTAGRGIEASGSYSADPLWSSSRLDIEAPSLSSYHGTLSATLPLPQDASQVLVSAEAFREQTPLAPRLSETLATELGGLDADLLASLMAPSVESYTRYSGLARMDMQSSRTRTLFVRGAGSYSRRSFDGPGPASLDPRAAPAEEAVEFSFAAGTTNELSDRTTLEIRAGLSGSDRDFGAAADRPAAYLAGPGVLLGAPVSTAGTSSRVDFSLTPLLRRTGESSTFEAGTSFRVSSHTLGGGTDMPVDIFYSDAPALIAGRGFAQQSTWPESSLKSQEFALFTEYSTDITPSLSLRVGGRYDRETTGETATLDTEWLAASGLANSVYPTSFHQFGARGALTWSSPTNGTRLLLTGAVHQGDIDVRAYSQVLSGGPSLRVAGTGIEWPAGATPGLPSTMSRTLTLIGPDMRAPRTTSLGAGLVQPFSDAVSFSLHGTTRRTDFLTRRRNLNLPVIAQATDADGRRVLGTLAQDGSIVTATGSDARRFTNLHEVWALDPDGWSRYMGITAGLEHGTPSLDVYASYTYSETTDNWVGAASPELGRTLRPALPQSADSPDEWSEGTSDFDTPHVFAGTLTIRAGSVSLSGAYHFRSGRPFTPRYRAGVDANGDGSVHNDVVFVPDDSTIDAAVDAWPCLAGQAGGFAVRNSCRGPDRHSLDARVQFHLASLGGHAASLTVDALNLIESKDGLIDDALLLVDPDQSITSSAGGTIITIPTVANPNFGQIRYRSTQGRVLRIGVRIGG